MTESNEILSKFKTREEMNMAYKQLKQVEDKEIIFSDTTKNIELYSDGTTNISREKYSVLEQENKELKKKLELDEVQLNSYFIGEEKICKKNEKYRSVLEEINQTLLGVRGLSIHCDKQIIKVKTIINEVLNA